MNPRRQARRWAGTTSHRTPARSGEATRPLHPGRRGQPPDGPPKELRPVPRLWPGPATYFPHPRAIREAEAALAARHVERGGAGAILRPSLPRYSDLRTKLDWAGPDRTRPQGPTARLGLTPALTCRRRYSRPESVVPRGKGGRDGERKGVREEAEQDGATAPSPALFSSLPVPAEAGSAWPEKQLMTASAGRCGQQRPL